MTRVVFAGVGGILVTSLLLLGVALFVLRRWTPPFWAFTTIMTAVGLASVSVGQFELAWLVPAAVVGGAIVDVLVQWLRPSPERLPSLRLFAALAPVAIWSAYFAGMRSHTTSADPSSCGPE